MNQEEASRKLERSDRRLRLFVVTMVTFLAIFTLSILINLRIYIGEGREQNRQRQVQSNEYIKCILLARYDYPPEQFKTREGTEKALDECSKRSSR